MESDYRDEILHSLELRLRAVEQKLLGMAQTSPSETANLAVAGELLRDGDFEDTVYAHPWYEGYRCRNRLVYRDPSNARSGSQYLAASDFGGGFKNPSIGQRVYVGFDGNYEVSFTVWVKNRSPLDRTLELVLWQYTNTIPSPVQKVAKAFKLTTEWTLYSVKAAGGGRWWKCEAYWHDNEPVDIMFDGASCTAVRV